ncbi:LysE family translocator [Paeniglutamicibacter gangotriensis]|uniref:Lysine exporter protein n=2 Tax=Paeniglutamicibacter gangotriensis TaxID=254787 RepID=M7MPY5_9MICC|nr:LysE family translocator [Paeniglutamicibacter gangotriensis]EMQ97101.1 lysine exporter protein [Paeniglutamicibacter gangotriensis Lz1y]KAA0979945.1 LysE family translocator [Paeniglutamicibacter gangotriensis]
MDIATILGFLGVSFALAMTPGADWAYAISAGLGRHKVTSAVAGLCSGYIFHTTLIVAGMATLVASNPRLLSWITLAGAAYLLWLGISTARSWRGAGFSADSGMLSAVQSETPTQGSYTGEHGGVDTAVRTIVRSAAPAATKERFFGPAFLRGLGTSGTNPKALLLYLALIPQFIHADAAFPVPVQTALLGISHMILSIFIYSGVALGARVLLRQRPTAARFITLFSGLIMIVLGLLLVAEQAPVLADSLRTLLFFLGK